MPLNLQNEAHAFAILREQLLRQYPDLSEDDRALYDTVSGETDLEEAIIETIRSCDEDATFVTAIGERIKQLQARASRLEMRIEAKRRAVLAAMTEAAVKKLQAPEFTISVANGRPKLLIADETQLPTRFLVPQPAKPDRAAIKKELEEGGYVSGANLSNAEPVLTIRHT